MKYICVMKMKFFSNKIMETATEDYRNQAPQNALYWMVSNLTKIRIKIFN